jgi:hypothetical protein
MTRKTAIIVTHNIHSYFFLVSADVTTKSTCSFVLNNEQAFLSILVFNGATNIEIKQRIIRIINEYEAAAGY